MSALLHLVRQVNNHAGHSVTLDPKPGELVIEVGTDTSVVRVPFTDANDVRSLAGHLLAEADNLQRYVGGAAHGDD